MATRKSHIIPQGHLKNFTITGDKKGKYFCYDIIKDKYIDSNGVTTGGFGWQLYTFSVWDEENKRYNSDIEEEFSRYESQIIAGMDSILKIQNDFFQKGIEFDRNFIDEDYIIELITLLLAKILAERAIKHPGLLQLHLDVFNNFCEKTLKEIEGASEEEIKATQEYITQIRQKFNVQNDIKKKFSKLLIPQKDTVSLVNTLKKKNRLISFVNDEEMEFCVSDFPIFLESEDESFQSFIYEQNVSLSLPLSKNILLTIGGEYNGERQYALIDEYPHKEEYMKDMNQKIMSNAVRYIGWTSKEKVEKLLMDKKTSPYRGSIFTNIDESYKYVRAKMFPKS